MPDMVYNSLMEGIRSGELNLDGTIKGMLVTAEYVPDPSHRFRFDVTHEVEGQGYEAGGLALADKMMFADDDGIVFTASKLEWPNSTITARAIILYQLDSLLIGYFDFDGDKTSENSDFTLNWNKDGILKFRG